MERRRLGRTDLPVSVLGFGGSEIGYEGASGATVARLLGQALDAGLTVVDTAECYERSEELIGAALGARRHECFIFTKCGHAAGWARPDWRAPALLVSIADQEALDLTIPPAAARDMGVIAKRPIANAAWTGARRPSRGAYGYEYWRRLQRLDFDFMKGHDAVAVALRFTL